MKHFEELWEESEKLHKDVISSSNTSELINELIMKINVYKVIDLKTDIPNEERQKIKSRTFGEILLTLTQMSLKDDINVFDALNTAYKYRSIEYYSSKYSD